MEYHETILLDDKFEADVVEAVLEKEGIDFQLLKYGDQGLAMAFSMQRGWGVVLVEESQREKACEVVRDALNVIERDSDSERGAPPFSDGGGSGSRIDQ